MNIGELTAILKVDDKLYRAGVDRAEAKMDRFEARTRSAVTRAAAAFSVLNDGVRRYVDDAGRLRDAQGRFVAGAKGFQLAALLARSEVEKLAGGLEKLAPAAKVFSAVGLVPVLMGTVSAVAATNGVIGLLPAIAMSAAVGIGALKVATSGFGDALSSMDDPEAFAEALEKLSPAARKTATAIRALRPAWQTMQQSVQERFFDGLAEKISEVGGRVTSILGGGFYNAAAGANLAAKRILNMLTVASRTQDLATIVNSGGRAFGNLAAALPPIVASLFDIGAVSGPIFEELTQGAFGATQSWARFIAQARETGQLEAWIRGGMAAFGDLMGILGNVGSLIGSMFRAANMDGAGLLVTVRNLTAGWAEWAASAEGQARMGEIFTALNTILATTSGVLETILPLIADLVVWFSQLPGPVQSAIVGFVTWGSIAGLIAGKLGPLFTVLGFLGPKLATVGGAVTRAAGKWGLLGKGAQEAAKVADGGVGKILLAAGRAAAGLMARALIMASAWLIGMGPIGWIVLAVAAAVGLIIYYWDEIKAALLRVGEWFAELPAKVSAAMTWLGTVVSTGARAAWDWLSSTLSSAIDSAIAWLVSLPEKAAFALGYLAGMVFNGAVAAWVWLSVTLPQYIDAALTWLAGLPGRVLAWLVSLGTTVAQGASDAYRWLLDKATEWGTKAQEWISGLPGRISAFLASLPGIVREKAQAAWSGFLNTATDWGNRALDFVRSLPGRITGFFSNAGSWLLQAGKDIVQGLWNGLKSMAQGVLDYIRDLGNRVAAGFKAAVGIHSPSKVFAEAGVDIGRGLLVGLDDIGPDVIARARSLADQVTAASSAAIAETQRSVQQRATTLTSDPARAAGEILARIRSGGSVAEDLTWRGASGVVGEQNDRLLDMASARGVSMNDRGALVRFLEQVQREGTTRQQAAPQGGSQPITINIHNPQAERSSDSINRSARVLAGVGKP